MDKILVIGASGLIGNRAMELGHERYSMFGTYHTHARAGKNMFQLDVSNRDKTMGIVKKIKPDLIIDSHTHPSQDYLEQHQDKAWNIMVNGGRNVAEAAKAAGAKCLYISTDAVFDGAKPATAKYDETDMPRPLNYYGKTKWLGELLFSVMDVEHIITRTAFVYGKGGIGKVTLATKVIDKLKNGEEARFVTDEYKCPTMVDSLIGAMFTLYDRGEKGIFHVTGKDCVSMYEYATTIADVFGLDESRVTKTTVKELNMVAKRSRRVNMDTRKVEKATGLKMLGLREGLTMWKEQMDGVKA